jgi:peptidyl-prolyl cis-trans isomerase SurA
MSRPIHWIGLSALCLAFFAGPVCAAEVVERILAVVNDEIVTEQDLETAMAPVLAQYRATYTGRELEERIRDTREQFQRKVIEDRLVLSEAKRRQVIVKDDEVDEMMTEVRNKFPSRELFLRALEDQGITEKKLWNRFKDQLMGQKLVNFEVKSKVSVSPGEVNDYYKQHPDEFTQGDRVRLGHILIRVGARSEDEAKALAEQLAARIAGGEPFEEVAKAHSEGAEAKEGGEMGWITKGQLMGEIDEKVFGLAQGQVTDPIKSSLGYHLFRVNERVQFSLRPITDVREDIQDRLFKKKVKERLDSWIADLKKTAYISIRN